jgi:Domain of unknown function (DUF4440)
MLLNRRNMAFAGAVAAGAAALGAGMASPAMACDSDELLKSVEEFKKAMIDANGARLLELSSDGLSFGHANGVVQTKVEFVKSVVDKVEIFKSIKLYDHSLSVAGDTGIARHTFDASINWQGKDIDLVLNIVMVWKKEDGRFRLVARQSFKPITV